MQPQQLRPPHFAHHYRQIGQFVRAIPLSRNGARRPLLHHRRRRRNPPPNNHYYDLKPQQPKPHCVVVVQPPNPPNRLLANPLLPNVPPLRLLLQPVPHPTLLTRPLYPVGLYPKPRTLCNLAQSPTENLQLVANPDTSNRYATVNSRSAAAR